VNSLVLGNAPVYFRRPGAAISLNANAIPNFVLRLDGKGCSRRCCPSADAGQYQECQNSSLKPLSRQFEDTSQLSCPEFDVKMCFPGHCITLKTESNSRVRLSLLRNVRFILPIAGAHTLYGYGNATDENLMLASSFSKPTTITLRIWP
jgi:hypothetical protein